VRPLVCRAFFLAEGKSEKVEKVEKVERLSDTIAAVQLAAFNHLDWVARRCDVNLCGGLSP
jgi:hypothetical protein